MGNWGAVSSFYLFILTGEMIYDNIIQVVKKEVQKCNNQHIWLNFEGPQANRLIDCQN